MRIAIQELKAGLSRYIAQARAGGVIEVTYHNKPVARITGMSADETPGVARLIGQGAAQWRGGKPKFRPVQLVVGGTALSRMVFEDRG